MATDESLVPTVLLDGLLFPECPRWREGKLWFSDMHGHRVMTVDLQGEPAVVAEVFFRPSGLGWDPEGRLYVISMQEKRLLRMEDGGLQDFADLGPLFRAACNDMVMDATGRAYIGSLGMRGAPGTPRPAELRPLSEELTQYFVEAGVANTPETSEIARVDPDGRVTLAAEGLMAPNGMVLSPDGRTLIVAETYANRLSAFDVEEDGSLTNLRVWAEVGDALPDGICLDEEIGVWLGSPYTHEFIRVLEGGEVTHRINLPDNKLGVACMLGGDDRRTLFLCTSIRPSRLIVPGRTKGFIETVRVEVPGAGLP